MTTGTPQPLAAQAPIQNFTTNNHAHEPAPPAAPTKRDLASWWKNFKRNTKKEDENKGVYNSVASEALGLDMGEARIQAKQLPVINLWNEIICRSSLLQCGR
jgi:hypothetical protein